MGLILITTALQKNNVNKTQKLENEQKILENKIFFPLLLSFDYSESEIMKILKTHSTRYLSGYHPYSGVKRRNQSMARP